MTDRDDRPLAVTLVGALAQPAVVIDASDRVVGWNPAAEAAFGLSPADARRTLAGLGLNDVPGAYRLPLLEPEASGAAGIVAWADTVARVEVELQRLRALARLAPGVLHQGRNHLAGFRTFFTMLRGDEAFVADYGEVLIRELEENARRAPELLGAFAELARDRVPAPAPQRLGSMVALALLLTEDAMDVRRAVDVSDDLPEVLADASRLFQALVAILVNALDALGGARAGGNLGITASVVAGSETPAVRLVIEDDAGPVPERDRAHLFDRIPPAGTTPRAGLDLATARILLERDGGTLRYEAGPRGCNRLVATLVASGPGPLEDPGGSSTEPGRLTVLVCDDQPLLRELMVRVLGRKGHRVLVAASGSEALQILDTVEIDILISDHNMSPMTGVALYRAACARHPHLCQRFILMSGDPGEAAIGAFSTSTGLPVLAKPFSFSALEETIRSLVQG